MNTANRERVKELLSQAARLEPQQRRAFIEQSAGGDATVVSEAMELLATLDDTAFLCAPTGAGVAAAAGVALREGPGTRIHRYKLLQCIGEGGFGTVFMAEQTEPVVRRVALKIIKAGMDTRQVIARFEAERQALALMDHPNIARVLDAGATESGRPYFVMELVRGEPITNYCDREQLPLSERLELFRDICHAVQHAHQKGIIHRDIKPSNVLVTVADGRPLPKIIDFGVAKATASRLTDRTLFTEMHQLIGTPEYMSPEQAEVSGVDIDTRSDVYALGVLLFELLTGSTPFDKERLRSAPFAEMQRIIREEEPPRPSVRLKTMAASSSAIRFQTPVGASPSAGSSVIEIAHRRRTEPPTLTRTMRGDLDWIVMKCLEKNRSRRFATASALAEDIGRYLANQPVSAMPPSRVYKIRKFARRNRGVILAGAVIAATLVAATAVSVTFALRTHAALKEKDEQRRLAEKLAAEAKKVAKFQEEQLAGIDAPTMGARLRAGLLARVRAAGERSKLPAEDVNARAADFEKLIAGSDFTGLALDALRDDFFRPTREAIEKQFPDQPLVKAQLLQTLATTLREVGLLDTAREPQEAALAIRRRELGDEHPDTLISLTNMGLVLQDLGKLREAEAVLRESEEKHRRVHGDEHLGTIVTTTSLGSLLQAQGKLTEAEPYLRRALESSRHALGEDHPRTLTAMLDVGSLLLAQGKMAEAEPYYREGLEKRRRVLGEENRYTLMAINNMSHVLQAQGKLAENEPYCREALEKCRRVLGEDHPDTLIATSNIASLLRNEGKLAEAEPYCKEALEKYRRVMGGEHPFTLIAISNMGVLLQAEGRLADAEPYYREALEKRRRVLVKDHSSTVNSVHLLGSLLREQGRPAEAEPYIREALEKRRAQLGEEHASTLASTNELVLLLHAQGKPDEAEPLARKAVAACEKALPAGHPATQLARGTLARVLMGRGRDSNVPIAERVAYFREAEGLLAPAAEGLESTPGMTSQLKSVLQGCIDLYDAWHSLEPEQGYDAKAAAWREKLAAREATTRPT